MTHFRTSATALETGAHQVLATQLTTRPGTLPSITIPVARGRRPDAEGVWSYLREPAEFFGVPMPEPAELTGVLSDFSVTVGRALVAATITIAEAGGRPQILMSGAAVQPLRPDAVRIAGDEHVPPAHRATDPWWRRMAARTTSKGELDQRSRWLHGRGYVDGLSDATPLLGALVFETPGGVVGVENSEPTSVLEQLARCGAITPVALVSVLPTDAVRTWWVSPRYETHPVASLAGTPFAAAPEAVPAFARWS